jgi:predicted HNH restriction endonuclease
MLKLRRAQDLVSQKKKSSMNLEQTLEALVDDYIKKHDPVEKAKRQKIKGRLNLKIKQDSKTDQASRTERASKIKQISKMLQVLRTEIKEKEGAARRFLDIHHIQPVSQGGSDQLENLALLCSGHHQAIHLN